MASISQYQAQMGAAAAQTKAFGKDAVKAAGEGGRAMETLGKGSIIAGGALAYGLGKVVGISADFQKQLSGVAAVSGASATQMDALSDAALKAGSSTQLAGVTASDAARAEAELVKAGVSVSDVLGGALMGSLSLASAGQLDFGKAAEISAQAMNMFGLAGKDVGHIADVLAASANKSAADVGQMGEALRQGGLVASQMGLSLEETVGTLSLFADNALVGSDAGTSLKTMLQRLTPQSNEAAQEMDRLGFSAFDAQGEFIGMEKLAGEMTDSFAGLTVEQRNAAFATIFGSDAVRAASVLYTAGEARVREYNLAVLDEGAAARMAATQMDNLSGDVEALGGALETALIKGGSQATGVLRGLTQGATDTVAGFSVLPPQLQAAAVGMGAAASAALLAGGAVATLGPKVRELKTALDGMGSAGQLVGRNMGMMAVGAAGAVIGLGLLANALGKAQSEADKLLAELSMDIDTSNYEGLLEGLEKIRVKQGEINDQLPSSNVGMLTSALRGTLEVLTPMEDSVLNTASAMKTLNAAEEEAALKAEAMGNNIGAAALVLSMTGTEVESLAERYGIDLTGALDEVQPALIAAAAEQETLGTAMRGTSEATTELTETQKLLGEAVRGMLDPVAAFGAAVDEKRATLQGFTDQQIANTGQSRETWEEFVANTKLSLSEYAVALEEQNENVRNWQGNLVNVAQTVGVDVALALAQMGEDGVHLTAEMANGTTAESARMATALRENAALGGGGLVAELDQAMKIAEQVSAGGSQATVDAIAGRLNLGVDEVRRIAAKYGVVLAAGIPSSIVTLVDVDISRGMAAINRIMGGLDDFERRRASSAAWQAAGWGKADGGIVEFFAQGGMKESHQAQIARAGDWRVWAEPETGGEAYIPLAESKRQRSMGVLEDVASRFGVVVAPSFAHGGVTGPVMPVPQGFAAPATVVSQTTVIVQPRALLGTEMDVIHWIREALRG